jgi:hypothetical protein
VSPINFAHDDIKPSFFAGKTGVFGGRCTFRAAEPKNQHGKPGIFSPSMHLNAPFVGNDSEP